MRDLGNSVKDIAVVEEMTPDAVKGVLKRYRHQDEGKDNKRSGRPKALTDQDKLHIKTLIERNPFISYKEIIDRCRLPCVRSTIRNWLISDGIQHRHALRRPFLTPEVAGIRKAWCDKYRREDESFWYSWWFSDEVSIDRADGDYTKWCFYRVVSLNIPHIESYSDHTTGRETSQR
jgi:hypothetical protein